MARWEIVFEHQMEIWKFWRSQMGESYARGFVNDMKRKKKVPEDAESMWDHLQEVQEQTMFHAEPVYIAPNMMELWNAAAETFEPEPLEASDLLTHTGFVYFPEPLIMIDAFGKRMSYRAFSWNRAVTVSPDKYVLGDDKGQPQNGILFTLYTHRDDEDDYNPELRKMESELVHIPCSLTMSHVSFWGFGDDFTEVVRASALASNVELPSGYETKNVVLGHQHVWGRLQSLFRLMQQKISTHIEVQPPRSTRRRASRQEFDQKMVTVIRLRRPKRPKEGEDSREVDWSHRWMVGAHWRNQWYPSLGVHRQVFIAPYIKGPEEKELRVRDKRVFEFLR